MADRRSHDARAACVLLAGGVVYVTLLPFGVKAPESVAAVLEGLVSFDAATAAHIVPAFALAILVRSGWGARPWRAAAIVFAGLVLLEAAQVFVEHRHARGGDLLAQGVGLWLSTRFVPRVASARLWRIGWAAVLAAWIVWGLIAGVRGQFGHTLGPMDTTFRLVVGDEHEGGRPWLGDVHGFSIGVDGADGPVVSFGPPPIEGEWAGDGALSMKLSHTVAGWSSVEPATSLCEALDRAGSVRAELDITPASSEQDGPARIVTLSKGLSYRNLTIGQSGDALVVRIRTPRSGRNASSPQFVFPGVLQAGTRARLSVWTDGGTAELRVDGRGAERREAYVSPRDWLGLKPGLGDAAGPIALFGPIGLAAGMLLARRRWIVAAAGPIGILAVIWGTALLLDRPIAIWLLPASLGASLAGALIAGVLGRGKS